MEPDVVSFWYFRASLGVWIGMPLFMASVIMLLYDDNDYSNFTTPCGAIKLRQWNCLKDKSHLLLPFHYLVMFIRGYAIAILRIYVWVPGMDIYWGVQNLLCHEKYEEDEDTNNHANMPAWKLYEQFGEAIPQFVIAMTFYAYNAHWLPLDDLHFAIFTMVMSAGSIVLGAGTGCRFIYRNKILSVRF